MNQVHKQTVFALSLMSITALAVVLVYMQMVNITNTAAGRLKAESADSLMDEVEGVLNDRMQEDINGICSAVYEDMVNEYGAEGNGQLGAVYKGEFYGRCANRLSLSYRDGKKLAALIKSFLPEADDTELKLSDAPLPSFVMDYDEAEGMIRQCGVKDIIIAYSGGGRNAGQRLIELKLSPPPVEFADRKAELNDYCMLGMKGIYISGEASVITGNIYAGTHDPDDVREEEAQYDERNPYGGINIVDTSLSVRSDTITTKGDINIKGASVAMGGAEGKVSVFANTINDSDSVRDKGEYTVDGMLFLRDGSNAYTNEEQYEGILALMDETEGRISVINSFYSSDGDSTYKGSVQKIIANDDVSIDGDYTGVVITTGNIRIKEGVNIEGLLIAGDRIYVGGNNNISSGSDIVNTLLAEEEEEQNSDAGAAGSYAGDYIKRL